MTQTQPTPETSLLLKRKSPGGHYPETAYRTKRDTETNKGEGEKTQKPNGLRTVTPLALIIPCLRADRSVSYETSCDSALEHRSSPWLFLP